MKSRSFDSAMSRRNKHWHQSEGEEAVVVGAFCDLRESDFAVPHFRGAFTVAFLRERSHPLSLETSLAKPRARRGATGAATSLLNPAPIFRTAFWRTRCYRRSRCWCRTRNKNTRSRLCGGRKLWRRHRQLGNFVRDP